MKKILSISLIFTLLMAFAMCVSAVSVEFDEDGQLGYASAEGNVENVVVKDGTLTFDVAEGGDAQVYIRRAYNEVVSPYGVVNADMSKEIEIRFATNVKSGSFIIYFTSINPEDGSWYCRPYSSSDTSEQSYMANVRRVDFETSGNLDDFVTVKIGRSDVPYWKGIVTSLRINAAIPVGSTISIDYIRFTGDEPEPQPEPEVHEKTQMILDEEKLYGECILFDDFESYELNDVPSVVYYSNAGLNAMHGADQLASYKVVTDIGGNKTKLLELVSAGATWKYPMLNVAYVLEEKGEFTMLMDAYTEVETAISWCFHNGYSATGVDPSTGPRYRDNTNLVTCNKWQTPKSVHGTSEIAGLTSVDYFRYGAYNLDEGEKVYIDNIRAYFKPYIFATVEAGGAEGDVPEISFVKNGVITFPECNLVKEGYKFAGWKNNINNNVYLAGQKMEVGDAAEITFTATWSKFRPVLVRKSSIRTDNGAQGMRFSGYVTNENRQQADEYGFIVSTESLLKGNQLVFGENTSETDGVSPDGVKYVYGVAYDKEKGVDIVYATSGEVFGSAYWADIEGYFFTGILTDIPESGYEEKIVIRPYARVGEVYSYGDPLKRSIRDIAQNAYDNGVREEYVMNILEATKNLPNKKVCFFGDSITHDGTFIKELYQHYLNSDKEMGRVEMYNVGISGDRASQALKRVDDELMYYDPDIVVMMFGMNVIIDILLRRKMR